MNGAESMELQCRLADSRSLQRPLALALAAAVMFVVANTAPLMSLSAAGRTAGTTIAGGAYEMWRQGYEATAAAVFFCAVLAPAGFIVLALAVLLPARRPPAPAWLPRLARRAGLLPSWAIPEVMLLVLLFPLVT